MTIAFRPLTLEDGPALRAALDLCPQKASDYTFVNLWAWNGQRRYDVAFDGDLAWLRATSPKEELWAPLGDWEKADWETLLRQSFHRGALFRRVPEKLARLLARRLGPSVSIEEERDQWEYLYLVDELIALEGNRFHKKKNLVNQFLKSYDWRYVSLSADDGPMIVDLQQAWCRRRNCDETEGLKEENEAIARVLRDWRTFPDLMGGALVVNETLVAYTVAEALDDTVVIHFEKGLSDYKGVYQAINRIFLERLASFRYVNREQDLGEEGLRKAKMSYNPVDFLRKYAVAWRT
ncbi:DUF2156 domain-containing protein [Aminithiophilus ramosus]|uniref:DUF2156 domain-containing protein n=2 Tax=Synergistales TaxID=649776 RepID=A0A9Q7EYD4_9BACT|nr:phosphatidylglycerol lysyltransferase domain-containing protein [Aminithiophilus ramosus]QTX33385.1 DUF2156 domain-containing protein [Aminithiophilus ramosus]QVL36867.1 DUF2156 domain-containing protein [Synergistota bacterium]